MKSTLSILLALLMLVSLVPFHALAENVEGTEVEEQEQDQEVQEENKEETQKEAEEEKPDEEEKAAEEEAEEEIEISQEEPKEAVKASPVLTIKFMEVRVASDAKEEEYTENVVVFTDENDELGIQTTVPRTHEGQIRGRAFIGWTNVKKSEFSKSNSNRIYSANNTVIDVIAGENLSQGDTVTLYAYYDGVVAKNVEIMGHYVPVPNDNVDKHKYVFIHDDLNKDNAEGSLFNGDIVVKSVEEEVRSNEQKNSWGEDLSNFAEGDRGSVLKDKTITTYYHPTIEESTINFQSSFNMHKGIALLVSRNGSWALSGSEVKLEVRIPEGMELANTLENVEFDSHTFRIKGVEATDKDNNKINATIENNNLSVENNTFNISFADGKGKDVRNLKLIVEPKKRGTWDAQNPADNQEAINSGIENLKATDIVKEMHWNGRSAAHISRDKAKDLAESDGSIELDGSVYGQILFSLNGTDYPLGMRELKSNKLNFKFVYPEVTFMKNTKDLGDDTDQELGKIKGKIEDAERTKLFIGEDKFAEDPTFTKDGKELKFLGWNTKPDGTGEKFTAESDLKRDIKVYAIWEVKDEPEPKPEPKPEPYDPGYWYDPSPDYLNKKPEPKLTKERTFDLYRWYVKGNEGDFMPYKGITRAEIAEIFARALDYDKTYFDDSHVNYPDVDESAWYAKAVARVTNAGIFKGTDMGNFEPTREITQGELISTLKRFQKLNDSMENIMTMRDDHWARAEVNAAAKEGWLKIYQDGTKAFDADKVITREEVVAIANKAFARPVDQKYIDEYIDSLKTFKDINKDMWSYYEILTAANTYFVNYDNKDSRYDLWVNHATYDDGPTTAIEDIKTYKEILNNDEYKTNVDQVRFQRDLYR